MRLVSLSSVVFLLASVCAAQAETWDGCYLSGGLLLATGGASVTDKPYNAGPLAGQGITWSGMDPTFGISTDTDLGVKAGIGCDRMLSHGNRSYVIGVIADITTKLPGGKGANPAAIDNRFSYSVDGIATLRGRAGLVEQDSLYYLTGGLALAKTRTRALDTQTSPGIGTMDVSGSGTDLGWVIGAGLEWQATSNVTMRMEFLHHEFDGATATGQANFPTVAYPRFDSTIRENTLSIGFNWRL